jgi:glycosyltransferase involved in cell wall biosynthesis
MRVAIVTPTIGSEHLLKCLNSVQEQTYTDLVHYLFVDGEQFDASVTEKLEKVVLKNKISTIKLQENVGKEWYGHRVYSACSFLVNADIICYLDEDNWFDPDHVESLVKTIEKGKDWAFSLRKIYDKDGNYICDDNCESLGKWPVYFNEEVYHIDTSCFAVRKEVAIQIGHSWYGKWGADRQFFTNLKKYFPNFECSTKHSLNYRLDGNPKSVKREFFEQGNNTNETKYNGQFPWKIEQHSSQVGPGIWVVT